MQYLAVLNRKDIQILISLVTQQIDRLGKTKSASDPATLSYLHRLIDMRNKLLAIPTDEEPSSDFSNKEGNSKL